MRFDGVPVTMIDEARSGDPAAVERLFVAVQDDMYAVLLHMLRNTEDAADALQECLIRVFRSLQQLQDSSRFAPWVMKLLVNYCHTEGGRRGRVVAVDPDYFDSSNNQSFAGRSTLPANPVNAAIAHEDAVSLREAIDRLSDRQRSAILLFELEDMSLRQTAEIMSISEGAVKFHLHEGRKNLRALLCGVSADRLPGEEARL